MKVLIVGSGGREHAIAASVAKSNQVEKIYCAPGNAGIGQIAECVDITAMEFDKLADFAEKNQIDLTIIGMDDPLVGGVVDVFEARGLRVFGPRKNAAIIEGSKAFSKDLMKKYNIPTAAYENFTNPDEALAYLETAKMPIVLKADGLALGKGVLICNNLEEAKAGVKTLMLDKQFGDAGNEIVIEEFMTGREVSVLCYCDGTHIKPMTSAQDHKRAKDGDKGLNTGGMGTFSPSPFYTDEVQKFCEEKVYQPTMDAMKKEGRDFVGILFVVGLISSAYSAAGSALTALTTSFTVDILGVKGKSEDQVVRLRKRVHVGMAVVMGIVIFVFNLLNNTSVIDAVYILASYTYGPILGLFAFGIFVKKQVKDKYIPLVAILSPILCFILDRNSQTWFGGYSFSYELLILNALFTFIGLLFLIRKQTPGSTKS